ncbi:hypothetical protein DAEQUDRAFT_723097 [Daedalea quercina L-15889]|uniref:MYND-type domain-containing protein n=1 Tax=Daedalea quercina L-15889 TaxID=1314783 RepID=A0A165SRP5_9APHY|nr:hypothetical protein DAEQUDRAFT_723097 [Daedalea quercina L-15889]
MACLAREPMVKLSVCSKCKVTYYCSRECIRKDWPSHKNSCRILAAQNRRIELLSLTSPSAAQRAKDWSVWRDTVDNKPYASALRLIQDRSRARTHIVFEFSHHNPDPGARAKDKFIVVKCGVFRISDIAADIEREMCYEPGGCIKACEDLLDGQGPPSQVLASSSMMPMAFIIFRFGLGVFIYGFPIVICSKRATTMDWIRPKLAAGSEQSQPPSPTEPTK